MTYLERPVFDFVPNWIGPVQSLTDDVSFDQVAPGGVALPWVEAGQPQALLRFAYALDRAGIRALEDFQDGVRGRLQGFWLPSWVDDWPLIEDAGASSTTLRVARVGLPDVFAAFGGQFAHFCLFQPDGTLLPRQIQAVTSGAAHDTVTLTAPLGQDVAAGARCSRLYYVRFADPALRFRHGSPDEADADIRFVELPREYASAELGSRPVWLYRIVRGAAEWCWAGYPLAIETANRLWSPAPIAHRALTFDKDFLPGDLTLVLATAATNHPFRSYLASPAIEPTRVQIFATEAPAFGVDLSAPFFEADGAAPRYRPAGVIEVRLATPIGAAAWPMPRHMLQRMCNHLVYEPSTCRLAAGPLTITAAITALGSRYIEAPEFGLEAAARGDPDWFALGDASVGSEVRMVVAQNGNRLDLNAAFVAARVGDTAVVRWGCPLLRDACKARGNLANFGGYPEIPNTDPKLAALEPPKSGGKKG